MKKYTTIRNYAKRHHKQMGMTLIELTVVLLILIGLAGLLIPYVGSFVQTTHDSTNANNMAQLNSAVNRYTVTKNRLPPHMDTLTNAAASTAVATGPCNGALGAVGLTYCGLANAGAFGTVADYSDAAVSAIQRASLVNSGINMVVANNPDIANKTFGTSTGMYMINTTGAMGWATAKFATVGLGDQTTVPAHLAKALGRDPMVYNTTCNDYLAFGLGDNNELVQSTAMAAPVYFPQDAKFSPTERYAHFIAIVQVDKDNTTAGCSEVTEDAKFLGVVANVPTAESKTLVGVNSLVAQGWENRSAGGN